MISKNKHRPTTYRIVLISVLMLFAWPGFAQADGGIPLYELDMTYMMEEDYVLMGFIRAFGDSDRWLISDETLDLRVAYDGNEIARVTSGTQFNYSNLSAGHDDLGHILMDEISRLHILSNVLSEDGGLNLIDDDTIMPDDVCIHSFDEMRKDDICTESSFSIVADDIQEERIYFSFELEPATNSDINVTYWITDIYGDVVRTPFTSSNLDEKQFTPSVDGHAAFEIIAELDIKGCNETYDASSVVVFVEEAEDEGIQDDDSNESSGYDLEIEHIYSSNNVRFGDELDARLHMANEDSVSDSELYVIDEHGEIISYVEHFGFFRGSHATSTRSVKLHEECSRDSVATLVLEAFGKRAEKEVFILCENPIEQEDDHDEPAEELMMEYSFEDDERKSSGSGLSMLAPVSHGMHVWSKALYDTGSYAILGLHDIVPGVMAFVFLMIGSFTIFSSE